MPNNENHPGVHYLSRCVPRLYVVKYSAFWKLPRDHAVLSLWVLGNKRKAGKQMCNCSRARVRLIGWTHFRFSPCALAGCDSASWFSLRAKIRFANFRRQKIAHVIEGHCYLTLPRGRHLARRLSCACKCWAGGTVDTLEVDCIRHPHP